MTEYVSQLETLYHVKNYCLVVLQASETISLFSVKQLRIQLR